MNKLSIMGGLLGTYVAAADCKVTWNQWRGQYAWSFRNGDPQQKIDEFTFTQDAKRTDRYCTRGAKSGKQCYIEQGNKLVHEKNKRITAQLTSSGDLQWSVGGNRSRLFQPCYTDFQDKQCGLNSVAALHNMRVRGWYTHDKSQKTADTGIFRRGPGGTMTYTTRKNHKFTFKQSGQWWLYCIDSKFPGFSMKLRRDGTMIFSNGFTYAPMTGKCAQPYPAPRKPCDVRLTDWVNKTAFSFPTSNPRQVVDHFKFVKGGHRRFCTISKYGKNCFRQHDNYKMKHERKNVWANIDRSTGMLVWTHGYTSKLNQDPCRGRKLSALDDEDVSSMDDSDNQDDFMDFMEGDDNEAENDEMSGEDVEEAEEAEETGEQEGSEEQNDNDAFLFP